MRSDGAVVRAAPWVLHAAAGAVAVVALVQSWNRWLHPLIDTGRDLYIPEQLLRGTTLYSEILYFYPPLTPYLLAAVTSVTGGSLPSYVAIGLGSAALTALALATVAMRFSGPLGAGTCLLLFAAFSVAGVSGWGSNYIFPYAHAAIFGMLFFLGAAALLVRLLWGNGGRGELAAALILLVAASWSKIEYAAFSILLLAFVTIAHRLHVGWLLSYVAVMTAAVGAAIVWFGGEALRENVLPASLLEGESARLFYSRVSGFDAWPENLLRAGWGALLVVLFVAGLHLWARLPRMRPWLLLGLAILTIALASDRFFRAWTVLQLVLVPFALRRPREPLAFLLLLSLCASSRIALNLVPVWYGFVLILPTLLLIGHVLFRWLPQRGVYGETLSLFWLPLMVLLAGSALLSANRLYDGSYPVETKRGTYREATEQQAREMRALLDHLTASGARTLLVLPEGLGVNYLSGIQTPLRHHTFTPAEIVGREGEIVAELERVRPQFVVLVPRDVREFGSAGFGVDYGEAIVASLRANYTVETNFGRITLLRLR